MIPLFVTAEVGSGEIISKMKNCVAENTIILQ